MATVCGYTEQQIDRLTLPYVLDLFTYWKGQPPIHEMVAAYLGIGKKAEPEVGMTPEDMAAMLDASGGKIVRNTRDG